MDWVVHGRPTAAGRLLTALAAWTAIGAAAAQPGPPASAVHVAPVIEREVQARRLVTGDVVAPRESAVAAEEAGVIVSLPIEPGQSVVEGDILATLDSVQIEIAIRRETAELAVARAAVDEQDAEVARFRADLDAVEAAYGRSGANSKELRDARADLAVAEARLHRIAQTTAVVEARLKLLEDRRSNMTIRAPYTGVIVEKLVERGEWVAEGDAVARIVSLDPLEIRLDVPENYYDAVRRTEDATTVEVTSIGKSMDLRDRRIVPLIDRRARTFTLILEAPNPDGVLSPGMSVRGWAPTGQRGPALLLPKNALMRNEVGFFVYVVREAGPDGGFVAAPQPVEVLYPERTHFVIRPGGLQAGDRVVTEGNERLYPTAPIQPIDTDPAAGAKERDAADRSDG